ncbi:MAG: putative metal-binding motif-containing protein [bacterium]|nr:putative metal-binding motif-containing protein [Myxococcales bacterium]
MRRSLFWAVSLLWGCVDGVAPPGADDATVDAAVDMFFVPFVDAEPDMARGAEFGEPCEENADCRSGFCVEAREAGRFCTRACGECPEGFECAPIGNAGPDRTFVCLVDQPDLCKPCETDRECDDPADLCLMLGQRTYCGEDCSADGVCPPGYVCGAFTRGNETFSQCAPADGQGCRPCLDRDGDGYGEGEDCIDFDCDDTDSMAFPGAGETCDGRDDDCDTVADEDVEAPAEAACLGVGLCRGTLPRCVGGAWACEYPDGYEAGAEASCDGLDNDCDGTADEDFDRQSDVSNCGLCGVVCAFAHAPAMCEAGRCVRGPCEVGWHDADGVVENGCEYLCALTRGGVEACDAIDNDCDGAVDEGFAGLEVCNAVDDDCDGIADEGFDLLGDVANCGACGRVCDLPDAQARCEGGACRIDACVGGFVDVDGEAGNGCEYACQPTRGGVEVCDGVDNDCNGVVDDGIDLTRDLQNCGRCGNVCPAPAQRVVACEAGICRVEACEPGYFDLDGNGSCEYACDRTGDEVCNGGDDDCDGRTDEGVLNACGQCGAVPGEVCDGVDNDCDGRTDEGLLNACGRCGALPAEVCNGVDDDCNGITDDHGVCGPYVENRCRLFIGWADNNAGPASGSAAWEGCPPNDRDNVGPVRCTATRRDGRFARIQLPGDVDGNDQIAVALLCDDASNAGLAAWVQSHCALFWGHADNNQGPDDSPTWGPCPGASVGVAGALSCTSSGFDGLFRKVNLSGNVDENDGFGFAWICRDGADPGRAAAVQASVDVFVGWADSNAGAPDGSATWGPCPGQPGGQVGAQRCTSTRGNGRFHLLRTGGDVDDNDQLGFALRARPAP